MEEQLHTSTRPSADGALPPTSAPQAWMSDEGSINNNASLLQVSLAVLWSAARTGRTPAGGGGASFEDANQGSGPTSSTGVQRQAHMQISSVIGRQRFRDPDTIVLMQMLRAQNLHDQHSQVCGDKRCDS